MYNVSNEYLEAISAPVHKYKLRGSIGNYSITDEDILDGSLKISKQCSEGDEVKIGSVYVGSLNMTVISNINIDRYDWKGKVITLEEGLELADGTYEWIPLGVYTIEECNYTSDGKEITAYDNMYKLDKTFILTTTKGTLYNMAKSVENPCGVTIANSDFEQWPNGSSQSVAGNYVLSGDNDIETYRDFIYWIAQTLGAVVVANRDGKIEFLPYKTEADYVIDSSHRFFGASFSAYVTRYSGMSVVDFDTQETKYYASDPDIYLTYNLGSNPLVQDYVRTIKDIIRKNILSEIVKIGYVPFQASILPTAMFDLTDVITFSEGIADEEEISCIMAIDYTYGSELTLSGFGSDPALASAKSKTDKDIAGLLANTKSDTIQFYSYLNTEEYDIPDGGWDTVISIRFASVKAGQVIFQAEILCDVDTADQIDLEVEYRLDYVTQTFRPIERWHDGDHILNLFYFIPIGANESHRWHVLLRPTGGSVHIDIDEIRATLWGQGLVGVKEWDGYIDCADEFDVIELQNQSMGVVSFTDAVQSNVQIPIGDSITEEFGVIPLINQNMEVVEYDEVVAFNKEIAKLYLWDDLRAYNWDATENGFIWG